MKQNTPVRTAAMVRISSPKGTSFRQRAVCSHPALGFAFRAEAKMTILHHVHRGHAPSHHIGCRSTPIDCLPDEKLIRAKGQKSESISLETGDPEVMHTTLSVDVLSDSAW